LSVKDIKDITEKEMALVIDHNLRASQLHNIRKVMNGSITPKKLEKMEKEVLPGYIVREMNARNRAEHVMKKYGMILKKG
jgi:transcription antitermination factor NusG